MSTEILNHLSTADGAGDDPCVTFLIDGRDIVEIIEERQPEYSMACGGFPDHLIRHPEDGWCGIFNEVGEGRSLRLMLLVCGCGEPGCSSISVEVSRAGDRVRWASFAEDDQQLGKVGPFTFDAAHYQAVLAEARGRAEPLDP